MVVNIAIVIHTKVLIDFFFAHERRFSYLLDNMEIQLEWNLIVLDM